MSNDAPQHETLSQTSFEPRFSDLLLTGVLALVLFVVPIGLYGLLIGDVPYFGLGELTQGAVLAAVALEAAALIGAIQIAVLWRRGIGWRAFGLRPHRAETFELSSDPAFVAKVRGPSRSVRRQLGRDTKCCRTCFSASRISISKSPAARIGSPSATGSRGRVAKSTCSGDA